MLHKIKTLTGYKLHSLDGEVGKIKDFYFDDKHWTVRYLVADTGDWLADRLVLISPHALGAVNEAEKCIDVDLAKKKIEASPSWNSDKPVSRQFEESYYGYYGWPAYWGGPFMWGTFPYIARNGDKPNEVNSGGKAWDHSLRSTRAVTGYYIHAKDGEIGHVEDFLVDDDTWAIRYLIIDTQNWWTGKKILISPKWIERISWSESKVYVDLLRESIKQSPEYAKDSPLTRDYEIGLHRHYAHRGYWEDEPAARSHDHT
jgi:sporulation protein YlmC with PRC-barrel domain